jgi:exopolyphosphatase/guanosine-5'-triphosphate,3'-diphosphate pyrophosphatase
MTRTAVIDIGTNTLLLLVVERAADGSLTPLVDLCRFGRLGQGLDASKRLAPEAIARSLEICREYRRVMDQHGVARPQVIATQAMREAQNAVEFVVPAEAILSGAIEVIAGEREAQLAATAVARTLPALAAARYVVVDVGGGSTELISVDGGRVVSAVSVKLGAVRMTERYLHSDPPTADEIAALIANIDSVLAPLALPTGVTLVGTAGTATTMASLALALTTYDPVAVTGLRLEPAAVEAQLARLLASPVDQRRAMAGIVAERADVIAAGVAIYARVMTRLAAPAMITCDRGIRWGIAYEQAG